LSYGKSIPDRRQIQNELMDSIGKENWMKLYQETRNQLIDTEWHWSAVHRMVGKGFQDWGAFATGYGKAIEGELKKRLESVFAGSAYRAYFCEKKHRDPDKNITLGPILHTLKNFADLPYELNCEIEKSGLKVHTDKQLIRELLDAWHLRNKGGHGSVDPQFTEIDFIRLRQILFGQNLLRRLIEKL
jgi:hypothetical protein